MSVLAATVVMAGVMACASITGWVSTRDDGWSLIMGLFVLIGAGVVASASAMATRELIEVPTVGAAAGTAGAALLAGSLWAAWQAGLVAGRGDGLSVVAGVLLAVGLGAMALWRSWTATATAALAAGTLLLVALKTAP